MTRGARRQTKQRRNGSPGGKKPSIDWLDSDLFRKVQDKERGSAGEAALPHRETMPTDQRDIYLGLLAGGFAEVTAA